MSSNVAGNPSLRNGDLKMEQSSINGKLMERVHCYV